MLLEAPLLELGIGSGLRTATIRARQTWQPSHAGDTVDSLCGQLAQGPLHHSLSDRKSLTEDQHCIVGVPGSVTFFYDTRI
jgi:hypothetical protein